MPVKRSKQREAEAVLEAMSDTYFCQQQVYGGKNLWRRCRNRANATVSMGKSANLMQRLNTPHSIRVCHMHVVPFIASDFTILLD